MLLNPEIGFWGGMALLVSSITGPGLTTGMNPIRKQFSFKLLLLMSGSSIDFPAGWVVAVPVAFEVV